MNTSQAIFSVQRIGALVFTVGVAIALSSCSAPEDIKAANISNAANTLKAPTSQAATATDAGVEALGKDSVALKTQRPSTPAQLVPTAMRAGSHAGFDRVVIELQGTGTPGWFIDYTDKPAQQGSGNLVEYIGDTALDVNIDGTVLPFEIGLDDPTLATIKTSGNIVTQVQSLGTFEGRSQFIIGLKGKAAPYSVQVLKNPTRVVIDIRH